MKQCRHCGGWTLRLYGDRCLVCMHTLCENANGDTAVKIAEAINQRVVNGAEEH